MEDNWGGLNHIAINGAQLLNYGVPRLGGRMVQSAKQAMIWVKLIYASGLLIPTIFFYFANIFPRIDYKPSKLIKLITFVPTGIFL